TTSLSPDRPTGFTVINHGRGDPEIIYGTALRAVSVMLSCLYDSEADEFTVRYERKGSHFLTFLGLAAALTCHKRLTKYTTSDVL
ncbi:hypothetical protein ABZ852_36585, partial [Streptomyces tanashiensis]